MKIVQMLPEFKIGGAELMCKNLCLELKRQGEDVQAVSLYHTQNHITDELSAHGIPINYLDKRKGLDLSVFFKLKKLLIDLQPDAVHTHLPILHYTGLICSMLKIPVQIHTVHNLAQYEAGKLQRIFETICFRKLGIIPVALSEEIQKSICSEHHIHGDIPVIENGIPNHDIVSKSDYALHKPIQLIHVGRLSPQKNHRLLLDAFSLIKKCYSNCTLHLYGEGELRAAITEQIQKLGLTKDVILHGNCVDIGKKLCDADIYVMSSSYEGVPLALIEAMAAGLPIVTTAVGGIPSIVSNNQEAVFAEENPGDLSEKIMLLINDDEKRNNLGLAAGKKSKRYSSEMMAQRYLELYRKNYQF